MKNLKTKSVEQNLATINKEDFTVTKDGKAFISQTRLAILLAVNVSSISRYLSAQHPTYHVTTGIDSGMLQSIAMHFAMFSKASNPAAKAFASKLMEAGAKAYIYHQAGFEMKAERELTRVEVIEQQLELAKEIEAKEIALAKSQQSFVSTRGKLGFKTRQFNEMERDYGQSDNFIPIAVMKERFPNFANAFTGQLMTEKAKQTGYQIKKVKSLHKNPVNQYPLELWLEVYPFLSDML